MMIRIRTALAAVILGGSLLAQTACLRFDCSGTDVVCQPELLLVYLNRGCEFTQSLNFNGITQQAYIKASNAEDCDEFGLNIAFDCATQTMVSTSTNESSNATGVNGNQIDNSAGSSGAAYVFRFASEAWSQEAYIKASNAEASDVFGQSVDYSGDTLLVGAINEDSTATGVGGDESNNLGNNAGAAYLFRRTGSTWVQEAYIKASNAEAGDQFGRQVVIEGDVLAVSTTSEASSATGVNGDQSNNSAAASGAVYVYRRLGGVWFPEAYLKASNTDASDSFGGALAISGDTIVVGAVGESSSATGVNGNQNDNGAGGSGAVYVFRYTGVTWVQTDYIKASNTDASDAFGTSVALSGDVLAVGASAEDSNAVGVNGDATNNGASNAGAVYIFRRNAGFWTEEAYIKSSNPEISDAFGTSVGLSGDVLAVGSVSEDSNATGVNGDQTDNSASGAGAAYVFRRLDGIWRQEAYVKASNSDGADSFADRVALSGDGLAISAVGEASRSTGIDGGQSDNAGSIVGAVYFFR
ncbi:MAG: FG-GAP repeat protein [bacterium]|nr:FG-GAP repeat protein [bacterium]